MYLIVSFQHLDVPQLKHLNTEPGVQEAFCRLMEIDLFFLLPDEGMVHSYGRALPVYGRHKWQVMAYNR